MPNKQLLSEILSFAKKYHQDATFLKNFGIKQGSEDSKDRSIFVALLKILFGQMLISWGLIPDPSNPAKIFCDFFPKCDIPEITRAFSKYTFARDPTKNQNNDSLGSEIFCELYEDYLDFERHNTGSFYTPDFIAEFMSETSLNRLFFDQLNYQYSLIQIEQLEEIPHLPEDQLREVQQFAGKFLGTTKICDPACGTGRFLIAIAKYLEQLFLKITLQNNSSFDAISDFHTYLRKFIVEQCIFGVEKDPFAAEICKLRLLAWYLEEWPVNGQFIGSSLPELHHIKVGNSLVGISQELPLKSEILEHLRIQSQILSKLYAITSEKIKEPLRKKLAQSEEITRRLLDRELLTNFAQTKVVTNQKDFESLNPFHWAFEFGCRFTLLIGNPPYGNILSKVEKAILRARDASSDEVYVNFLLRILRDEIPFQYACFLTPKSYLIRQNYLDFRNQLLSTVCPYYIYDIGSKMFRGALNEVQVLSFHRNAQYASELKVGMIGTPPSMVFNLSGQDGPFAAIDVMRTCTNESCPGLSGSSQFSIYTRDANCPVCGALTRPLHRIRIKLTPEIHRLIDHIERAGDLNLLNPREFPDLKRGEEDQGLKRVKGALQVFTPELCAFVTAKNDFSPFSLQPQKSLDLNSVQTQKDTRFYATGPKLLIKHNSIIPEAVFTKKATIFTAAIYSLLFPDEKVLKYLCGILNSKLMQFYCIFGINNQNLVTMNLNQYMIRHLPIPSPHKIGSIMNRIIDLVDRILEKFAGSGEYDDKRAQPEVQLLDQEIYALYGITGEETIKLIEQSVNTSLRSFSQPRRKK